jgi:DNA mismatch endonuclease (patch repair protein)
VPRARPYLASAAPSRHELVVDGETSARLARIRQHGTSAELTVRKLLHALGRRFRVHNRDLPGSPDIANRSRQWVVFVHGCFWHRHAGCKRSTTPSRNREFWMQKFDANVARDARVQAALRAQGYRVLVVWECETDDVSRLKMLRRVLAKLP